MLPLQLAQLSVVSKAASEAKLLLRNHLIRFSANQWRGELVLAVLGEVCGQRLNGSILSKN